MTVQNILKEILKTSISKHFWFDAKWMQRKKKAILFSLFWKFDSIKQYKSFEVAQEYYSNAWKVFQISNSWELPTLYSLQCLNYSKLHLLLGFQWIYYQIEVKNILYCCFYFLRFAQIIKYNMLLCCAFCGCWFRSNYPVLFFLWRIKYIAVITEEETSGSRFSLCIWRILSTTCRA